MDLSSGSAWRGEPLFVLGKVVATRGVVDEIEMEAVCDAVAKHEKGDWGQVPAEDKNLNDEALKHGGRLLSKWTDTKGTEFYIITEADRSVTTALLLDEY